MIKRIFILVILCLISLNAHAYRYKKHSDSEMQIIDRFKAAEIYLKTKCPIAKMRFADNYYLLPSVDDIKKQLENFYIEPYVKEKNDCDNRAVKLLNYFAGKGFAFGWASVGDHDICTFIDNYLNIWFIEPSTREIYKPNKDLVWLVMP